MNFRQQTRLEKALGTNNIGKTAKLADEGLEIASFAKNTEVALAE